MVNYRSLIILGDVFLKIIQLQYHLMLKFRIGTRLKFIFIYLFVKIYGQCCPTQRYILYK